MAVQITGDQIEDTTIPLTKLDVAAQAVASIHQGWVPCSQFAVVAGGGAIDVYTPAVDGASDEEYRLCTGAGGAGEALVLQATVKVPRGFTAFQATGVKLHYKDDVGAGTPVSMLVKNLSTGLSSVATTGTSLVWDTLDHATGALVVAAEARLAIQVTLTLDLGKSVYLGGLELFWD
jgi:hypothetical protein